MPNSLSQLNLYDLVKKFGYEFKWIFLIQASTSDVQPIRHVGSVCGRRLYLKDVHEHPTQPLCYYGQI